MLMKAGDNSNSVSIVHLFVLRFHTAKANVEHDFQRVLLNQLCTFF